MQGTTLKTRGIWLLAVGLVGLIVAGLLLAIPSMLRADDARTQMPAAEFASIYRQALVSSVNNAKSTVKDPELAAFSQKLVQSYELEKTGANANEGSALSDLLPDVTKINKNALEMPLKEAGKQIKDKDISDFYSRFLDRCGVDSR